MIARMKHIGLVFKEIYLEDMTTALHKSGIFHINEITKQNKYSEIITESCHNIETENLISDFLKRIEELRKIYRIEYKAREKEAPKNLIELKNIEEEIKRLEEESKIKEEKEVNTEVEEKNITKENIINSKSEETRSSKNSKVAEILTKLKVSLDITKKRNAIKRKFGRLEGMVLIDGWIPKSKLSFLKKTIKKVTQDYYIEVSDPEEKDKVPIELENNELIKPFEILTKLYSAPVYKDIDPTPVIALTFPLIFGIMTADLIDGLVLFLASIIIIDLWKDNDSIKQIAKIGIFLSISSMIFGIMFGEALGGLIKMKAVFNPFTHISQFMIIVLAVGIAHITIGLVIAIIQDIRKKKIRNLIYKTSYLIIIPSLILLLLSKYTNITWWTLGAGFVLLIVGKGSIGLLESPRLLSNVVSYGRILAINMAHIGIAKAFTLLGNQIAKGIAGTILAIFTILIGHFILLTLGTIIAFIHTLRLHFVEFFSKFKEDYGIWYNPFSIKENI